MIIILNLAATRENGGYYSGFMEHSRCLDRHQIMNLSNPSAAADVQEIDSHNRPERIVSFRSLNVQILIKLRH